MKLSKQAILDLQGGLVAVGNLGGAKFAYAVARNVSKLKGEVEALQKAYARKPEYLVFEQARIALAESHSLKVDGKPKKETIDGVEQYVIEDQEKFDKELAALKEQHKQVIDDRRQQLTDFKEILKEEVEIDLYTIPPEYLPEDITAQQMAGVLLIVKEEA